MKRSVSFLFLFLLLSFTPSHSDDIFNIEMGCKTKHWVHVQKKQGLEDLATFRELFHRNADLVKSASGPFKIPKIVHFIWLGPAPFPPKSVSNIRSWIAQNPDWTFKFWTDRPREAPCHGMETIVVKEYPFPYLGRCYKSSTNWGEKSDLLRFEILFQQGGVYVDHDASCLTSFEPYHQAYEFYCGLETPHPPLVGRNITAGNGLLGSRPGHPIIQQVIHLIDQKWDLLAQKYPNKDSFSQTQIVMERTYIALTDALHLSLNKESSTDIVFPASYFFSKKGLKPVLSQHFFANSWASPFYKNPFEKKTEHSIVKIEKKFRRLNFLQFAFFSFNLILLSFSLYIFNNTKWEK